MERKLIAAAVSSALALPMAAHAVEGSVSGHVNRAIIIVNQTGSAKDGDVQHKDSNASETRFRFTGSEDLGNGSSVGVQLEIGRPSAWRTRHANVYFSGGFGKLTIGQASAATDNMAHARLGGPSWLAGVTNWCSYATSGPACPSNDGHRREVLKYDTPAIGPASIAASYGDDDYWDVVAKFASSMDGGGYGYDLRIGYIGKAPVTEFGHSAAGLEAFADTALKAAIDRGDGMDSAVQTVQAVVDELTMRRVTDEDAALELEGNALTVSGTVSFGQGTSVAVAWSEAEADDINADHSYFYTELDHSYGDGSVGVYYKTGEYDLLNAKLDGELWGVGIGHNVGAGATAYAGYRHIESDGAEDIDLMLAGMRVTFN